LPALDLAHNSHFSIQHHVYAVACTQKYEFSYSEDNKSEQSEDNKSEQLCFELFVYFSGIRAYPTTVTLARKYLTTSTTAVPCEQPFSLSWNIISKNQVHCHQKCYKLVCLARKRSCLDITLHSSQQCAFLNADRC